MTPNNAGQTNVEPIITKESELEQVYTAESGPTHSSGNAEEIARRVFSAPVEGDPVLSPTKESQSSETEKPAAATSNTEIGPVPKSDTVSATGAGSKAAPEIEPPTATKNDVPVGARIAPTIAHATTETTVSGPSSNAKLAKDSGKVSSWLKTKFSRRASKPAKPDISSPTEGKEKAFIGGASLAAPEASNTSSDHGDSGRGVAAAGKGTIAASATGAPVVSPLQDEDASTRSPAAGPSATDALRRESTSSPSISSLSSDEDTRGRSVVPREWEPLTQKEFVQEEIRKGHVDPAAVRHSKDESSIGGAEEFEEARRHSKDESSIGGAEEFEEARDTFDMEMLSPPAAGIIGGTGRKSDSPARDSKFMEDL